MTLQTTSTFTSLSKSKCPHKDEDSENAQLDMRINKNVKFRPTMQHKLSFKEFIWSEHSCAYNSLLTILLAVYLECEAAWNINIPKCNRELKYISGIFRQATRLNPMLTLSNAKNRIRKHFEKNDLGLRFLGSEGIDIYALCKKVF